MGEFHIGDRGIGQDEPTFIIAEAGSNHNGDLEIAKELIDVAADAGADAVKFQTFRAEDMYVEESGQVDYLEDNRPIYEIIESMEMPYDWIPELYDYCHEKDVLFLSTPFDKRSADELAEYVTAWKIASYTMSHHPFLKHLAGTDKPIIMSTGAHKMNEIEESVDVLQKHGCANLVLLHCIASYPTPLKDINVAVVENLQESFGLNSGLSDHTMDPVTAPSAAVALGAAVIEKHFTLDKGMDGPDHQFALEPDELRNMITAVRKTEEAVGEKEKQILDVEKESYNIARRSIQAAEDIEKGAKLTDDSVKVLRPGKQESGLHPKYLDDVLDCHASRHISRGEGIRWDDLEEGTQSKRS
jgi:N-acetylneuraminate synthase